MALETFHAGKGQQGPSNGAAFNAGLGGGGFLEEGKENLGAKSPLWPLGAPLIDVLPPRGSFFYPSRGIGPVKRP